MAIPKRLRYEILRRDNYRCRYCGVDASETTLVVDHVTPEVLGGRAIPENLVTSRVACNAGKSSVSPDGPLVADVAEDAVRWAAAMEFASELRVRRYELVDAAIQEFDAAWRAWHPRSNPRAKRPFPRPDDWVDTIERFIGLDLDSTTLVRLVGVTMRKPGVGRDDLWSYFCGCCWRTLEDAQGTAATLLEDPVDNPAPDGPDRGV